MTWQFDQAVASVFVDHARQHIPNYDLVINKCVALCQTRFDADSSIIDVGCATGETLRRFHNAGFTNLTGVESSQDMLAYCDPSVGRILHSDNFPKEMFDVVLCNWTLHFVEHKLKYLEDIYSNMNSGGILVLSEKTSLDPAMIEQYHLWKKHQGVGHDDIVSKEKAIKDIMYIDSIEWYLDVLTKLGFRKINIIDASWCFTTFVAVK